MIGSKVSSTCHLVHLRNVNRISSTVHSGCHAAYSGRKTFQFIAVLVETVFLPAPLCFTNKHLYICVYISQDMNVGFCSKKLKLGLFVSWDVSAKGEPDEERSTNYSCVSSSVHDHWVYFIARETIYIKPKKNVASGYFS